jgi:2-polyprenyl-3-methyl-5-hydroxy-6-metoxy-1,4-benzoquinol methylase
VSSVTCEVVLATHTEHEARRFSLSPEALYVDCYTRVFLRERLDPASLATVCNVGIGQGLFDDWLGYWLADHATLTSVDIDGELVQRFRERQEREGHLKAAHAVHADLMQADLGQFDLVTVVGSTIHETHAPALALRTSMAWVKPGGWLFATLLHGYADPDHLLTSLPGWTYRQDYTDLPGAAFTAVLARG